MDDVSIIFPESMGKNFIPHEYLPRGEDEYYQRNKQTRPPESGWRQLQADEVERLVKNNNTATNWDDILVTDPFDANQIKNTRFFGLVRIGRLRNIILQHHDLKLPAGITNSLIVSCDIGDDVAIHEVHYLAHYIIGNRCMLFNIHEMDTTDHAKFGNGIVKEGEPEGVRTWIDLMNEMGGRKILPFDGMITADAYLWAKYRDDTELQKKLLLSGLQRRQKATIEPQLLLLLAQRNLVELDSFRHTAQLTAVSFLGQCLSMNSCLIPTSFGWKHSARVAQPRSRASLIPMSTWRSINRS